MPTNIENAIETRCNGVKCDIPINLIEQQKKLDSLKDLSCLMDSKYSIFGLRFGLDSIVGLVPAVGDFMGLVCGIMFVLISCSRFKFPFLLKLKMVIFVIIDFLIGIVPVVGDYADILFKANVYNYKSIESFVLK
ncbi:hypothetical protein AYI69_g7409 [Smittium culicis]|uniref:DUF4112 domain-containing protein n=1 Tax=Smittium culicis TaxID=133412 RepID=A0A1R1XS92_9FUNG|nr:hypothetical protein AYI69_g7409 [Smittium culicis]